MKKQPNKKHHRFFYTFENWLLKGTGAWILLFLIIYLLVILVCGLLLSLVYHPETGMAGSIWDSLIHVLDPGVLGTSTGKWSYLLMLLFPTFLGMMFTSILISIVNNGMEGSLNELSKGRTKVQEKRPHTVVLGYNEVTEEVLRQLSLVNAGAKKAQPVVVMAETEDISEIHDSLVRQIEDPKKTKLICRGGKIYDYDDLEICSLETCKTIIICGRDDFETIGAILACARKLQDLDRSDRKINAVIRHSANEEEARIAGGDRVQIVGYERVISRILAGSCREPGLSYVYNELLDYDLQGFFQIPATDLIGEGKIASSTDRFALNRRLADAIVVGGILKDGSGNGLFSAKTASTAGDYQSFFAVKDATTAPRILSTLPTLNEALIQNSQDPHVPRTTPYLILGYGGLLESVLREEDEHYKGHPLQVTIADSHDEVLKLKDLTLQNIQLHVVQCETSEREVLRDLVESTGAKSVLVLSSPDLDARKADEEILSRLLFLQNIREDYTTRNNDFTIACELNSENTRRLADLTGVNDFAVGSSLVARIATQIACNADLYPMLQELLGSGRAGICMRPMTEYLRFDGRGTITTDIHTVEESAARKCEIYIGIHRLAFDKTTGEMVYQIPELNPDPDQEYTFWAEDEAIVLTAGEQ